MDRPNPEIRIMLAMGLLDIDNLYPLGPAKV
jgi:hypothetical protein